MSHFFSNQFPFKNDLFKSSDSANFCGFFSPFKQFSMLTSFLGLFVCFRNKCCSTKESSIFKFESVVSMLNVKVGPKQDEKCDLKY